MTGEPTEPIETDRWVVLGIKDCFPRWVAVDRPEQDQKTRVFDWLRDLAEDPYVATAKRVPGFSNYWQCQIPRTARGGKAVLCCFFIYEATHSVDLDQLATLDLPII